MQQLFFIILLILSSFTLALQAQTKHTTNQELKSLYQADQAARSSSNINWKILSEKDKQRRERVMRIIQSEGLSTGDDYYHSAMIFQHGETAEEIQMAYSLATISYHLSPGNKKARWLIAAAWDRIMMRKNMPQWYGTQYSKASPDEPWELYKIDETAVTDEERVKMNVPPLYEAKERVKEMNR